MGEARHTSKTYRAPNCREHSGTAQLKGGFNDCALRDDAGNARTAWSTWINFPRFN